MALSPRTNAFLQPPPSNEDTEGAFEQGFSQMATSVFMNKYPDLASNVVTFKIIESNMEDGSGVGAFILDLNGEQLFVPVVLANNQIKPIEILYFKDKNVFVPLKRAWIDEISRHSDESMGEAVKEPKNLQRDLDIRNIVIPPTTGRYAYASAGAHPGAKGAIDGSGKALASFLDKSPNYVKKAFVQILERNKSILKFAAEHFDIDQLANAIQPKIQKTAAAEPVLEFLTPENSAEDFRRVFGKEASNAFQIASKIGYVMRDQRPQQKLVVETETPIRLHEAKESGFYRLSMTDGTSANALVIAAPQKLEPAGMFDKRTDIHTLPDTYKKLRRKQQSKKIDGVDDSFGTEGRNTEPTKYLVLLENGKYKATDFPPVGKKLQSEEVGGALGKIVKAESDGVASGSNILFVGFHGNRLMAVEPVYVRNVSTDSKDVRRITTEDGRVLVTDQKSSIHALVSPKNERVTYMPTNFIAVKITYDNIPLYQSPDMTLYHRQHLEKNGAERVKVFVDDAGQYSIGGRPSTTKVGCVYDLVKNYRIDSQEAEKILAKTAQSKDSNAYSFYVMTPVQFTKYAQGVAVDPATGQPTEMPPQEAPPPEAAGGQMPPGAEGAMPPEMAGAMPPEMMAPPMPPPPSPVDLAVADVGAQYAQQAADTARQLAQQQQQLADRMSVLQEVKQRADQIAGVAPTGDMLTGMSPEMQPGQEDMMSDQLAGHAENIMAASAGIGSSQVDNLNAPELFEATAIGAMSANPDLRSIVAAYVPNLEEALDNLARILLTLWMKEKDYSTSLGELAYNDLEERLRLVFNNLGTLILKINQTATAAGTDGDEVTTGQ